MEADGAGAGITRVLESCQPVLYREGWQPGGEPIRVGRALVVCPRGSHGAGAADRVIELDLTPDDWATGVIFGTGAHPTTQLVLALQEERLAPGDRVLDVGTGSGILAIAAALLGAAEVLAVDVDAAAVDCARANVALNRVAERVQVIAGSADLAGGLPYDLVLANILAPVLRQLAPELARHVRPTGLLIVSGVVSSQAAGVVTALREAGFEEVEERAREEWRAFVLRRRETSRGVSLRPAPPPPVPHRALAARGL